MLAKSIVAAGIRVFSLAIAFIGIRHMLSFLYSGTTTTPAHPVAIFFICVAAFLVLWRYALKVASVFVPEQANPEVAATAPEIEAVGLRLIGLYFAFSGLNRLSYCLLSYYTSSGTPDMQLKIMSNLIFVETWSSIFQLFLGAALFFGRNSILRLLHSLRNAGLPKDDQPL